MVHFLLPLSFSSSKVSPFNVEMQEIFSVGANFAAHI
jgi:hypothetical protein